MFPQFSKLMKSASDVFAQNNFAKHIFLFPNCTPLGPVTLTNIVCSFKIGRARSAITPCMNCIPLGPISITYYAISAPLIICQMVAHGRSKTNKSIKLLAMKVFAVAYERWSLTRSPKYSDLTWKLFVLWKTGHGGMVVA